MNRIFKKRGIKVFSKQGFDIPDLFRRWKDDDEDGSVFKRLVDIFISGVNAKIRDIVEDCKDIHNKEQDTEELTHIVFLKMFKSKGKIKAAYALSSWLDKTAHHATLDHIEQIQKRNEVPLLELAENNPSSSTGVLDEERNRLVRDAIERLPVKQQIVINALIADKEKDGQYENSQDTNVQETRRLKSHRKPRLLRTNAEVARELGCSKSQVVKLAKKAQETLKKILGPKLL